MKWFTTVLGIAGAGLVRDAARETGDNVETAATVTETCRLLPVFFDAAEISSSANSLAVCRENEIKE